MLLVFPNALSAITPTTPIPLVLMRCWWSDEAILKLRPVPVRIFSEYHSKAEIQAEMYRFRDESLYGPYHFS